MNTGEGLLRENLSGKAKHLRRKANAILNSQRRKGRPQAASETEATDRQACSFLMPMTRARSCPQPPSMS